ncbi:hypothetical protein RFI_23567 [Reticulomyxa filosa]|uniref:Uncharacterized protein n=1 Tax=Reticulomyxa filosa TaxID=46433 RepID=X6MIG4_RETFI|nr:hypothetical protein RFI_23567 [Reticulomyxa filosa]|eukprot:ETO13798.1 hypothetical protein RFI_23567 [Reticulomyxa filosa]
MVVFFNKNEAMTFFVVLLFWREVLLAPVICYLLFNFWKYQKLDFIYRRRPLATIVLAICTVVEIGTYFQKKKKKGRDRKKENWEKKKVVLPFCRYNLLFNTSSKDQKVYDWFSLSVLIHETMLIPRFWFLYYDWQLGKDLNGLVWEKQLYLRRLRISEVREDNISPNEYACFVSDYNDSDGPIPTRSNMSDVGTNPNTNKNTDTNKNINLNTKIKLGIDSNLSLNMK